MRLEKFGQAFVVRHSDILKLSKIVHLLVLT